MRLFSGCKRIARQSLGVAARTLLYFNTPSTQRRGRACALCSIQKEMRRRERNQGQRRSAVFSVSRSGAAQSSGEIGVQQTVKEVLAGLPANRQPSGNVSP
jgi:hypothetical protein